MREERAVIEAHRRFLIAIFGSGEDLPRIYYLDAAEEEYLIMVCRAVVFSLPDPTMRLLVIERFGLRDGKPAPLKRACENLQIGRGLARQIEAESLKLLRHPFRSNQLRQFIIPTKKERAREMAQLRRSFAQSQKLAGTSLEPETELSVAPKEEPEEILRDRKALEDALREVSDQYSRLRLVGRSPSQTPGKVRKFLKRRGITRLSLLAELFVSGEIESSEGIGNRCLEFIARVLIEAEKRKIENIY